MKDGGGERKGGQREKIEWKNPEQNRMGMEEWKNGWGGVEEEELGCKGGFLHAVRYARI